MADLVAAVTFLIASVVFLALWLSFSKDTKQEVVRQRIESVRQAEQRGAISADLTFVRDEMYSSVPLVHRWMLLLPWSSRLQKAMAQAGLKMKPGKVLLLSIVLGLGTYLIVGRLSQFLLAMLGGIIAGALPIAVVVWKRHRRLRQFEERFPEALDMMVRAVRAGHAFTAAMEMVAQESPEPLAGEFSKSYEEQNFGLPFRDVLLNLTERVPLMDVRFFATALLVQKETGGNLAEILEELSRVVRERFRIYREVQVKTALGRLTAAILIALPIALLIVLNVLDPVYERVLFTDPMGPTILAVAVTLQIVGALIIWRIVDIEV
jgi:tight adherence protein B